MKTLIWPTHFAEEGGDGSSFEFHSHSAGADPTQGLLAGVYASPRFEYCGLFALTNLPFIA